MDREQLKLDLKKLIIRECQKNVAPEQIADDDILIGSSSRLDLDSLDALQIALAVKQHYGKRIDGSKETRMALKSINTLADFILTDAKP
ncbi:MAG TPA: phosphopantetheine-binding protein [Gammaproteobacteria bacterium]|nr:phosphopantetheine-binding protein [Gammaproteobacteria bacterium]